MVPRPAKQPKPTGPSEAEVRAAILAVLPTDEPGWTTFEVCDAVRETLPTATSGAVRIGLLQLFIGGKIHRPCGAARYVRRETA